MSGVKEEYGKALFLLSEESDSSDRIREDALIVKAVIRENPEIKKLADTPAISKAERLSVIDRAFGGLSELTLNTAKLLAERHAFYLLDGVMDEFLAEYDLSRGIERAEVITALPLTEEQKERLRTRLEKETGKTVILNAKTDPTMLGGVKLRYMGKQLDGSLRARLDRLRRQLADTVV